MIDHSEKKVIERIIALREDFSGKRGRKKFATLLGISPSTYSYYEKDRVPPIPILLKICEICNVDIGWLLTCKNREKTVENDQISLKIRKLIKKQPASLQAILAFLDLLEQEAALALKASQGRAEDFRQDSAGWIPVLGRTAAGVPGLWGEAIGADSNVLETHLEELVQKHINASIINSTTAEVSIDSQARPIIQALSNIQANLVQTAGGDDQIVQFVDCPQIRELLPDCFALQIDGDSMAPRISDGDIVIVSPSVPAGAALPAIVRISGAIGVTCKLVRIEGQVVHLVPINEKYDTKIVERKDLLWALAVLCHIRLKNVDSIC
jgi:SOS-response transcriptional repressor LexA